MAGTVVEVVDWRPGSYPTDSHYGEGNCKGCCRRCEKYVFITFIYEHDCLKGLSCPFSDAFSSTKRICLPSAE